MKCKKEFSVLFLLLMIFSLVACGSQSGVQKSFLLTTSNENSDSAQQASNDGSTELDGAETEAPSSPNEIFSDSHILVAYFSRAGENYSVGVVEKGNTHIIADMIAEETGADMFEIQPVNPYPDTYDECKDVAEKEKNGNARPEIVGSVGNMEQYDTVFIGYPIWWGDLPMVVYTFLESYDLSGKTIIPFCTHEGSGLSDTISMIEKTCPNVTILDGFAIRGSMAQNQQDEAKSNILNWLTELDY